MTAVRWVDMAETHLADIRFQVTRADGKVVDFSDLVREFGLVDHVNTAGVEVNLQCAGPVAEILQIGAEGSSARIIAPLVDLETGVLTRRELWRGTFEEVVDYRREGEVERYYVAYDIAKFLTTSEEDLVFKNLTLSEIVSQVLDQFQIPRGTITTTTERLGQIVSRGRSIWDALQEARQRHADRTGQVFRVFARDGRINLAQQGAQTKWWVFETGESIRDIRRIRTLAEMVNQIKVYGQFSGEDTKPAVVAVESVPESVALYGLRQRIEYLASADDEARALEIAKKTIDRYGAPDEQIEVTGWLVPSLRAGEKIRVIDTDYGLDRVYYVESIDSTWAAGRAETVATARREPVDPEIILAEVVSA